AVAGLRLDRGDAVPEEGLEPPPAGLDQVLLAGFAGRPDTSHDAAGRERLAADPGSVLVSTGPRPEEVDVGVHEARDDAAAVGVDDCRALGQADAARPAARRAHPDDLAVAGGDGGLLEEAERAFALVGLVGKLGIGADMGRALVVDDAWAGFTDPDNQAVENMHEAPALIAGGSLQAAQLVHSGRARHAFSPAGGLHHAMRHQSSGFCVYNDVAVAAAWLREQGHRVAVVDVDVHHGDGTQAAFEEQPDV